MQANGTTAESSPPPGVVELREDVPLKVGTQFGTESSRCCGGGPRFILGCFAALSAGITLALLTQIYYGDYQVVPHGSVSSSAGKCSRAGMDALKAGGRAMDAAATTALCLAILLPHRTSIDASGSLLYWEYRTAHSLSPTQPPILYEWGQPGPEPWTNSTDKPPKMLAAFAFLHSKHGVLSWSKVLEPAIAIARDTVALSKSLSVLGVDSPDGSTVAPDILKINTYIANYLEHIQGNSSKELAASWESHRLVSNLTHPPETPVGSWNIYTGSSGAVAATALANTFIQWPANSDDGFQKVVTNLEQLSSQEGWPSPGVASGLAVVDHLDTYIALTTGLTQPYGSGPVAPGGWICDEPQKALDLAPAILVTQHVCGTRYIMGAETSSALAQAATALLTSGTGLAAIDNPRVTVFANATIGVEGEKLPPEALPTSIHTMVVKSPLPYPSVNAIMQIGDKQVSTADNRGGGTAFRF